MRALRRQVGGGRGGEREMERDGENGEICAAQRNGRRAIFHVRVRMYCMKAERERERERERESFVCVCMRPKKQNHAPKECCFNQEATSICPLSCANICGVFPAVVFAVRSTPSPTSHCSTPK